MDALDAPDQRELETIMTEPEQLAAPLEVPPQRNHWMPFDFTKSTSIADIFIPYAYCHSPIIATALKVSQVVTRMITPGDPDGMIEGLGFRSTQILNVPIVQIGLPAETDPVGISAELAGNRIPHLLRTANRLRACSSTASASVPCDLNGEPLESEDAAWAAYRDVVKQIFSSQARRPGRDQAVAGLLSKIPRLSDTFIRDGFLTADAIADNFVVRRSDDVLDKKSESKLLPEEMSLLFGSDPADTTIVEGPRLAAMDLAIRWGLHEASTKVSTLVVDCLNRDIDPSERMLLIHSKWPSLSDPLSRFSSELKEEYHKIFEFDQLPLFFQVDDSGCAITIRSNLARWSMTRWGSAGNSPKLASILFDAQNILTTPDAALHLVQHARCFRQRLLMTIDSACDDPLVHLPALRDVSNWIVLEPVDGAVPSTTEQTAYRIRIRKSQLLPPIVVGIYVHDPSLGTWAGTPST